MNDKLLSKEEYHNIKPEAIPLPIMLKGIEFKDNDEAVKQALVALTKIMTEIDYRLYRIEHTLHKQLNVNK